MEQPPQLEKDPSVDLEKILDDIEAVCEPTSIFLYGSRARTDATAESDYEIGVLLPEDKYVSRAVLRNAVQNPSVSIYPFRLEQFREGNPDTPFNKKIYLRELIATGKTLRGEEVIENLQMPSIEVLEAWSDAQFNLGRALSAVVAARDGALPTAAWLFYKSCLFATRALIMERTGAFPATYEEIVSEAEKLDLGEYQDLVRVAYQTRQFGTADTTLFFKNISYLNQFVVPALENHFKERGNEVIVE